MRIVLYCKFIFSVHIFNAFGLVVLSYSLSSFYYTCLLQPSHYIVALRYHSVAGVGSSLSTSKDKCNFMSHVLIRSRMTYRDDYDQGKAIPNSVYMVTSRPHQKSIILLYRILPSCIFMLLCFQGHWYTEIGSWTRHGWFQWEGTSECNMLHISVEGVALYYRITLSKWFYPDLIYHFKLQWLSAILCCLCLSEWLIGMTMSGVDPPDSLSCSHIYWCRR